MNAARFAPAATLALAAATLATWLSAGGPEGLVMRVPGADRRPTSDPTLVAEGPSGGTLQRGAAAPADLPGSWPCFRGARRDGISDDPARLAAGWGEDGPRELWSIAVGEGHAGAAIHRGRVYLLDYDRERQHDALRCLSLETGQEIWRFSYPVKVKRNHGMSRAVPAVTDEHVVAMGPKCHVICLDAAAGTLRWSLDLAREYGAEVPQWYAGQCPLVELGAAVLAPSGACLMMAVECATGRTLWQTPNPRAWKMTHTSIAPMELDGRRTYVYAASGGVAGVAADDGRLLWDTEIWRVKIAAIATPVVVPPDRVFLSGGYNVGAMMIRIVLRGDAYVAEEVFSLTPKVFGAEQSTPVYHDGHIYGVRPNGELVCLDLDGRVVWTSGHEVRFGKGLEPYIVVGDTLLVMSDAQVLTAVEAAPGGYRSLGSHRVLDGHDSWGPMAVAGGRLIVRDLVTMKCIDLEAK